MDFLFFYYGQLLNFIICKLFFFLCLKRTKVESSSSFADLHTSIIASLNNCGS